MIESPVPVPVAVRGQCLGGGLELAASANFIFGAPDAIFGQPEINLGVFAPPASCLPPEKLGQVNAEEAYQTGLVKTVAADPEKAAVEYFQTYLARHSAEALRYGVKASRISVNERIKWNLDAVKKPYPEGLMTTHDAPEGIEAFLEKRKPIWKNN